ncbi:MAG: gluconate permease [Pseudonocardia sp.]|nr:gluconate permease [Pseudonocardia sp.]
MPLVVVALAVAILLLLMTKFRLNGFVALIIVAILVGVLQGMPLDNIYESILDGIGGQLDDLVLILGFGAMFGRILADSGAAQKIATSMTDFFGISRVQLAMVLSAFAIGITMFYEVGFVILIPLVFTIVRENKLPLLWVGLPMSIALSTMHSFLPPHLGPAAVAGTFHASMALTLVYGLVIAIPVAALIAFTWPRLSFVKKMNPTPPRGLIAEEDFPERELPSFATCLGLVLIPIVLMGALATAEIFLPENNPVLHFLSFFGEASIALLIALLVATFVLGEKVARTERRRTSTETVEATPAAAQVNAGTGTVPAPEPVVTETRHSFTERAAAVGRSCTDAVKPMAIIILIIGAGGAFKQVLVDSGIADYIKLLTEGWNVSPIILAWGIAVLLRVALGSATVAVVTAAGVVLPLVAGSGVAPELMVLAVTCGSIFASHVNDPGFWLFKEFFNLSVVEAIKTRTSYTTVLSILGLGGVLALNAIVS